MSKNKFNAWEKFNNLASVILDEFNIGFDLIEVVKYNKDHYGIKISIEKAGTYLIDVDEEDFIELLEETKAKILSNPLKCPFCKNEILKDNCSTCGAKFMQQISSTCSMNENYTDFSDFKFVSEKLTRNTTIEKKSIDRFLHLGGKLENITTGFAVVYEGASTLPIFCMKSGMKIINLADMDMLSLQLFVLSSITINNVDSKDIVAQNQFRSYDIFTINQSLEKDYVVYLNKYKDVVMHGFYHSQSSAIDHYCDSENIDRDLLDAYYESEYEEDILGDLFFDAFCGQITEEYEEEELGFCDNYLLTSVDDFSALKFNTLDQYRSWMEDNIKDELKKLNKYLNKVINEVFKELKIDIDKFKL